MVFALLKAARAIDPGLPVVLVADRPSAETVTAGFRLGADDFIERARADADLPESITRLAEKRRSGAGNELLRRQVERPYSFDDIIGTSPPMRKVFETIEQVAQSNVDVLVLGETGTGKELVARAIHRRSPRAKGPFVPVDCGAIPDHLLESELFGHERGAFTGADSRRIGLFSNSATMVRCFSTNWANCRSNCSRSCCGHSRSASSAVSAVAMKLKSTSVWSPRRRVISKRW